ncbi:hypothetical protein E4U43_006344 [Claviceps pusilla]|uniref:Calcineurin-like phosphoesterase domain-containing protein n=1 Tax=Claviceps pusilla TaxID=123648 RepID=A0A9P7N1Y0_9HYPO|nr:hypothetical protein E4U43_006344 [Claviceps pusilla]
MYQAIHRLAPDAQYTIFTGDIVEREVWNTTPETNSKDINDAYQRMKTHFPRFCPAVGNHEASPANWFPARDILTKTYHIEWLYSLLTSLWKGTNVGTATSPHHRGRYVYSVPTRGLRIIGINTNLYYYLNLWLYREPVEADPDGQLKWLVFQLQEAEWAGDRVWIVGHMPMGDADAVPHSSGLFNDIVTRYNRTVAAMFFGHTHSDQYQINYAAAAGQPDRRTADTALLMSYIAPSLTPSSGFPAFRVYTVDKDTHAVLDSATYFANMSDPTYQIEPVWESLYSLKTDYAAVFAPDDAGAADTDDNDMRVSSVPISAAAWHDLTEKWQTDPDLFDIYWQNKHTGSGDVPRCNDACRRKEICFTRNGRNDDSCENRRPGGRLGRVSHCGSSILLDALGGLFDPDMQAKIREVVSPLSRA